MHKLRWLALIFVALLIAGFGVAFFWWQHHKTTPAYSLALLVDAAQRNDAAAFDRVVDMEKVTDNLLPQVMQRAAGGFTSDLATSLGTQLQSLAPGVAASVKQIVKEAIRKRISDLAGPSGSRPFFVTALAVPFRVNLTASDSTAKGTMNSGDQRVELLMERGEDGQWRVVSLRDDALATRVVSDILKALPASRSRQLLENLPGGLPKLPLPGGK